MTDIGDVGAIVQEDKTRCPLPWCDWLDRPYYVVNLFLCFYREGWREFQRGKAMSEIIPAIDALRAA